MNRWIRFLFLAALAAPCMARAQPADGEGYWHGALKAPQAEVQVRYYHLGDVAGFNLGISYRGPGSGGMKSRTCTYILALPSAPSSSGEAHLLAQPFNSHASSTSTCSPKAEASFDPARGSLSINDQGERFTVALTRHLFVSGALHNKGPSVDIAGIGIMTPARDVLSQMASGGYRKGSGGVLADEVIKSTPAKLPLTYLTLVGKTGPTKQCVDDHVLVHLQGLPSEGAADTSRIEQLKSFAIQRLWVPKGEERPTLPALRQALAAKYGTPSDETSTDRYFQAIWQFNRAGQLLPPRIHVHHSQINFCNVHGSELSLGDIDLAQPCAKTSFRPFTSFGANHEYDCGTRITVRADFDNGRLFLMRASIVDQVMLLHESWRVLKARYRASIQESLKSLSLTRAPPKL